MFSRGEQLREVETGMPVSVGISPEEDTSRSMLRGVSSDGKGVGEVRELED